MLRKLLKYDLKYMIKNMIIFYVLAIFFAVLTRVLGAMNSSIMLGIIHNITIGCAYAMIAAVIIFTMMKTWIRFRDSIYKDESYLTHTLPVTKNQIYNSKLLQALIFYVISFVVVIGCLLIMYYNKEFWAQIRETLKTITTGLNYNTVLFVISFFAVVFLEIFSTIQCGFFGIIMGHRESNGKVGFSVLFGYIAYMVTQSIVLLLVFIVGLFNDSIMNLFKSSIVVDMSAFKILMVLSIILYVIVIFLTSLVCKKALNKGVNVD